jgi:hypothetical protein
MTTAPSFFFLGLSCPSEASNSPTNEPERLDDSRAYRDKHTAYSCTHVRAYDCAHVYACAHESYSMQTSKRDGSGRENRGTCARGRSVGRLPGVKVGSGAGVDLVAARRDSQSRVTCEKAQCFDGVRVSATLRATRCSVQVVSAAGRCGGAA